MVFAADLPHGTNLAVLKRLGFALAAEGHVAELDRDPVTAAGDYLAAVRLGQEQSRGGLIIDSLVGIAVESIGLTPLEKLAPGLDAKECRKLATELERSEARRESARTFIANDDRWARRALGWRYYYYRLISLRTHAATVRSYSARYAAIEIRTRLLVLTLAARAYELERGHRPANPAELVPEYLHAVPLDPLTGTNLVSIP
ncbi:MAG TPA: hypothetical protein VG167_04700 [Verrucomicrobiae bacterium]|nr:hypothetical protein [Verrucomicrobiae bacterium]